MSTTRERLAELEAAEFDTFGEQDKGPGEWPLATPEEVEAIKAEVNKAPWEDPARFPECLQIAMDALGLIAVQDESYASQLASQGLRSMARRATFGGPLSEPHEPSWSLDPERRMPMRGE